jgi:hypothetical protein
MRIAITGASGFLGGALAARLRASGHQVLPIGRARRGAPPDLVPWDPEAGTLDTAKLEAKDAVVHLAAESLDRKRWSEASKRRIRESRVHGTEFLARSLAGLSRRPRVLVSGSAMGIYGDRGDEALTEASAPGDDFLAEVATAWEAATRPAAEAGIRVVLPRTGLVLSRAGGALPKLLPLFRLGLGGRLGSGRQWMSWIHLDDWLGALEHALAHDAQSGPYNATAPAPVTNADFTRALGRALHRPTLAPVPAFALRLALGEMAGLLLGGQRVLPRSLEEAGYRFRFPSLEGALADLLA